MNPSIVVIQDLIWTVYSGDVGMRWARDLVRVMEAGGGGTWGNCYYVYLS